MYCAYINSFGYTVGNLFFQQLYMDSVFDLFLIIYFDYLYKNEIRWQQKSSGATVFFIASSFLNRLSLYKNTYLPYTIMANHLLK